MLLPRVFRVVDDESLQDGDKGQRVQMTAFQSMRQGSLSSFSPLRGSQELDSPMAAAISASMAGAPPLTPNPLPLPEETGLEKNWGGQKMLSKWGGGGSQCAASQSTA